MCGLTPPSLDGIKLLALTFDVHTSIEVRVWAAIKETGMQYMISNTILFG